jgi:hypothetical protein
MLERTSRFVLEVLPYLLLALVAAVVVPGFLYSQAHGANASIRPNVYEENTLEIVSRDHAGPGQMLSNRPTMAGNTLADR